ncbi:hypothetical protein CGZ69_02005 [Streptomyces peucetius subsp. caesius ATCC 27952]|nr:hypothetical protein CGZ69_02005 [Streptomyces peucetius subsp. caesius ATCC 27952]
MVYVLDRGGAWRDVPAQAVGCSGVTGRRRPRDRTEAGVWPRPHETLSAELRRTWCSPTRHRPGYRFRWMAFATLSIVSMP